MTKENLDEAKRMTEFSELRHLNGLKGYFAVQDSKVFYSNLSDEKEESLPQLIISLVPGLVQQQQYFFNTLWDNAIAAQERIRQIEPGVEPEFIETISETSRVQRLAQELIKNAKCEILGIFSSPNAFRRQVKAGTVDLVRQKA